MKFWKFLARFFTSKKGVFLLGAILGAIFFAFQFGFSCVNPFSTDWIFNSATHDTEQHFLGWEFFRASSSGAVATNLAFPVGLPITFMDAIPLFALPFNFFAEILPANFQYFGIFALICYVLQGAISAILMRKIWRKVFAKKTQNSAANSETFSQKKFANSQNSLWQILFITAGSLIFIISPMMLARTLYHPALAAQFLILIGILLIWDAKKFEKVWKFSLIWSIILVVAILIHPYFLPMLGAMMTISALRNFAKFDRKNVAKILLKILIPVIFAGAIFYAIGGFALGSGAEIHDLEDKGFNLLSFAISNNYSAVIPSIPQRSYSPETMMWLGLGIWILIIFCAILFFKNTRKFGRKILKNYEKNSRNFIAFLRENFAEKSEKKDKNFAEKIDAKSAKISRENSEKIDAKFNEKNATKIEQKFKNFAQKKSYFCAGFLMKKIAFRARFKAHFSRNILMILVAIFLLIFAVGVRVDFGPISLFQYGVPEKIYDIWSAFRAAAREAWVFYYALILFVIYVFSKQIFENFDAKNAEKKSSEFVEFSCEKNSENVKKFDEKIAKKFAIKNENISHKNNQNISQKITQKNDEKTAKKTNKNLRKKSTNFAQKILQKFANIFSKFRVKIHIKNLTKNSIKVVAIFIFAISIIQFCDIYFSKNAGNRRENFAQIYEKKSKEFVAPNIKNLVKNQKNLVELDIVFRYDQSGFYELGQAALENNLTLNIGFFARIPDEIWTLQNNWREKITHGKLTKKDFSENIFATKDENLAREISKNYQLEKRGNFWFISEN